MKKVIEAIFVSGSAAPWYIDIEIDADGGEDDPQFKLLVFEGKRVRITIEEVEK